MWPTRKWNEDGRRAWCDWNEFKDDQNAGKAANQYLSVFTRTWLRYVRVYAIANPSVVQTDDSRLSVCRL